MSVVIAIKENDRIYFGCDTQVTVGQLKYNQVPMNTEKVTLTKSGIIVGCVGKLKDHQRFLRLPALQEPWPIASFDTQTIMHKLINPWVESTMLYASDDDLTGVYEMNTTFVLGYYNRLFSIDEEGGIKEKHRFDILGSGTNAAYPFVLDETLSVEERLEKALVSSAKHTSSVSEPFVYLTTRSHLDEESKPYVHD